MLKHGSYRKKKQAMQTKLKLKVFGKVTNTFLQALDLTA